MCSSQTGVLKPLVPSRWSFLRGRCGTFWTGGVVDGSEGGALKINQDLLWSYFLLSDPPKCGQNLAIKPRRHAVSAMVDLISDTNGQDRIFFPQVASVGRGKCASCCCCGFQWVGSGPAHSAAAYLAGCLCPVDCILLPPAAPHSWPISSLRVHLKRQLPREIAIFHLSLRPLFRSYLFSLGCLFLPGRHESQDTKCSIKLFRVKS